MKKLFISVTLLLFLVRSFGQQIADTAAKKVNTDYLQKSKKQKTAAWILLCGGVGMMIAGTIVYSNALEEDVDEPLGPLYAPLTTTDGLGLVGAGFFVSAGSIPLFIASGKNKRKAASISLENEQFQHLRNGSLVYKPMPAVCLKINL